MVTGGDRAVVSVAGGQVRGTERDGIWRFWGIPYAAPPIGDLRWRPPQAVVPWSGVRQADQAGPIAPQTPATPGLAIPGDPAHQSEDCLSLNVWTPGCDQRRRPVLVWIHGGGFTGGTGSSLLYRGETLAGGGDVVVVTCNYRLGALGFLGHPALGAGNWGLADQVAVLQWVRDHIAGFGGDPGCVTLFGESAGGMSVSALLAAPTARGLFHRAVIQSGPPFTHTVERAARAAQDLAGILGLSAVGRPELERVPAADLVAATAELQNRPAAVGELPLPFLPVVDGEFLEGPPQLMVATGRAPRVPLLIGTTRDELSLFTVGDHRLAKIDDEQLVRWIGRASPELDAGPAVDTYRRVRAGRGEAVDPKALWVAMGSDRIFRWPSLWLAAAHRPFVASTFAYLFTWETPIFGGILGSCHALEIPFVFGTVRRRSVAVFAGGGPEAEALSEAMRPAWTSFARTGDPSHPGIGQWPAWDPARRSTMVFGRSVAVVDAPRNQELSVWEDLHPLAEGDGVVDAAAVVGTP